MTEFGSAALAAARSGARNRGRRRLGLVASVVAHCGVAVMLAFARPPQEPPPAPPPEPVLLRLAPPRAPSRPAEPPRPVKPPPRRRPVVQPPPVVAPPVEQPPPEPEAEEPTGEAPESDAAGPPQPFTGSTGDGVHQLKEVARAPSVLEQVVPEYPRAARRERIVGLVLLRVVVGLDGRVEPERTVVIRSVPELDAAAIAAIHRWRFSPAVGHSGRPVRVVIEVPFQFSLR